MYISKAFLFFIKKMLDDAGIPYLTSMEQYLFLLLRPGETKTLKIFTAATVLPFR